MFNVKSVLAASVLAIGSMLGSVGEVKAGQFFAKVWTQDYQARVNCHNDPNTRDASSYVLGGDQVIVNPYVVSGSFYRVTMPDSGFSCWVHGGFLVLNGEQEPMDYDAMVSRRVTPTVQRYSVPRPNGNCQNPNDRDSRGRRCGRRAASIRKGGR